MGLLDSVLGAAMGGTSGTPSPLLQVLMALLASSGGSPSAAAPTGAGGLGGLGGLLGGALGGAWGGAGGTTGAGTGGLGSLGGLGGLLGQLSQAGLGDQVASWVGTGGNLPVSADQLSAALGHDRVRQMAEQVGLQPGDLAGQLSQFLPQVVDRLTPQGQLPAEVGVGDLGQVMGGLLGQLGGR